MRGYKSFDATPHPGDLRHRVEIGYTENIINENGYPDPIDTVICTVWADAVDAGNQGFRAADTKNVERVINFTIRHRDDVRPGMWVRFKNEKWMISALGGYGFTRQYLGLKASIVKGVSG
jgi:SPP1 family predicted phage head-tail adaptor